MKGASQEEQQHFVPLLDELVRSSRPVVRLIFFGNVESTGTGWGKQRRSWVVYEGNSLFIVLCVRISSW